MKKLSWIFWYYIAETGIAYLQWPLEELYTWVAEKRFQAEKRLPE